MPITYPMAMITRPGRIEFVQRELSDLGEHEALIQVKAAAICGSDLHIYKGMHPSASLPVTVGHEIAGEVIQVGAGVRKVKTGDRVTVEPVIVCGECYFCQRGEYHLCTDISFQYRRGQGGFTTHFVCHEDWAHKLPGHLSYEEGALIEPLSVAVHAVGKSRLRMGESAAVFGDGPIGLLILMVARLAGAQKIFLVGGRVYRLQRALELGASQVINNFEENTLELILEGTLELGVERSFEAVGLETTLVQSLKALKKGGLATLVGLFEQPEPRIPANLFVAREIGLIGSQGYNWDFQKAIELAAQKRVDLSKLITHVLPMNSLQEGFELFADPQAEAIKVVLVNE